MKKQIFIIFLKKYKINYINFYECKINKPDDLLYTTVKYKY